MSRTIPAATKTLLKSRSMIGTDAPRCQVTFSDMSSGFTPGSMTTWTVAATGYSIGNMIAYSVDDKMYACSGGQLLQYNGTNAWVVVAPTLSSQTVYNICEHNGKIYGGTGGGGRLFEWNGFDAWVEVAPQLNSETKIGCLISFGGNLYGGTYPNGNLFMWNGTNAWVQKVTKYSSAGEIYKMVSMGTYIYATAKTGDALVLRWGGTGSTWSVSINGGWDVWSPGGLTQMGNYVFFSGGPYGKLLRTAGSGYSVVSQQLSAADMRCMTVFNDTIIAGTFTANDLYYWNGTNLWVLACDCSLVQAIDQLCVWNDRLYFTSSTTTYLWGATIAPTAIQPSEVHVSREEAANAQRATIRFPNVNPSDPTDAGYYSPYRSGTDFPLKTQNAWHDQIVPSKPIKIECGYGANIVSVFTGAIDDVNHDGTPAECSMELDCRDGGASLVDKTITAVIDGTTEYYIDYPIDSATTASWLTSNMFVVMAKGDKMKFTSDLGGPVTLTLTAATYTGATLATHLASVMNANTTLTGSGTITFSVSYNTISREFTISASGAHTIAFTLSGSTAAVLFGMTEDVVAANSIVSVEPYTATIETVVKDLCVRAGFLAANITIEPTYQLVESTFERMSYGDAVEEMCTLSGFEFVIDEDNKPIFRYPTDRQPEAVDEAVVLTSTTPVNLANYPVVTASILVYSGTLKSGTLYSSTTDYVIVAGTSSTPCTIARRSGSTIPSGGTVYVTYVYAAWVFKEGEDIFRLNLKVSQRDQYGKIIVEGDDCKGTYTATSPRWDTSTIPSDKVLFVLDETLDTDAKCQAIANRLAADMASHYIEAEWAAVAVPWLQVGDCVQIIESSSTISEIYRITSMELDFDNEGFIMTFRSYHYGYAPI